MVIFFLTVIEENLSERGFPVRNCRVEASQENVVRKLGKSGYW